MTSSAVKRMNLKFEAIYCLENRPGRGRQGTIVNAAGTVQKKMEIVACSFTNWKLALVKLHVTLVFHTTFG